MLIPGTGSGMGPQAGGFLPNDSEREYALRKFYGSSEYMERAMRDSQQMERLQRSLVDPWMGGAKKGTEWMYGTSGGYAFQQLAGAAISRNMLGGGNPMEMAYGVQQLVGRTGAGFTDSTGGNAGINRTFGGAGFVTDQMSQQLFKGLQSSFFGASGNRNMVSGLNQDQVGVLLSAMGDRRAMSGQNVGTFERADLGKRLDHYRETGGKYMRSKLEGVNTEKDLDARIAQASKEGDTTTRDALMSIQKSEMVFKVDKEFQKKTADLIKGTAEMVTTLGDIMGSDDVGQMLKMAEQFSGKAIKSAGDARKVKQQVDEAVSFAESQGISGKAYLQETMAQGQGVQAFLAQRFGINPLVSGPLAAGLARDATRTGAIAFGNQGRGQNFSAGEASSVASVGAASRLGENQELVAAASAMFTGGLDDGQKAELQKIITSFGTAATEDERKTVGSNIDAFFMKTYGKQAYNWMDGARGRDMALTDPAVTDMLTGVLSTQVSGTVVKRGVQTAMDRLSLKDRAAMTDPRFLETAMMSFQGTTADKLVDLMAGGDTAAVRSFLEENKGFLTDANGKQVSVDEMMGMIPGNMAAAGKALKSGVAGYRQDPNVKGGRSNEGVVAANSRQFEQMMSSGRSFGDRTGVKSFTEALANGWLTGSDGQLTHEGILGLATELDPTGMGTTGTMTLDVERERIQASADQLTRIGGDNLAELLGSTGADSAQALSDMLKGDDKRASDASNAVFGMLGRNFKVGSIQSNKLTAVTRESYDKINEDSSMAGKRGMLESLAGMKEGSLVAKEDEAAEAILKAIGGKDNTNTLLADAATGDSSAIMRLKKLDKSMQGQLSSQMDIEMMGLDTKIRAGNKEKKGSMTKEEAELKRLQDVKDNMDEKKTNRMIVTNMVVMNYTKPEDVSKTGL